MLPGSRYGELKTNARTVALSGIVRRGSRKQCDAPHSLIEHSITQPTASLVTKTLINSQGLTSGFSKSPALSSADSATRQR